MVDYWMLIDNSKTEADVIAEGQGNQQEAVHNPDKWTIIKKFIENDKC